MNKTDLREALQVRHPDMSAQKATDILDDVFDIIAREVARGGKVGVTGFGTFERVDRKPRTGRNPRTGESVAIAATAVPKFRPGDAFKAIVESPGMIGDGNAVGRKSPTRR